MQIPFTPFHLVRKLLYLYPQDYRKEYQAEIIDMASAMLREAPSRIARYKIIVRLTRDFVWSVTHQHSLNIQKKIANRPQYIRKSSLYAVLLLVPYVLICAGNFVNSKLFHRGSVLSHWEARLWLLYCVFMPLVALMVVMISTAVRIITVAQRANRLDTAVDISCDALMLSIPLTCITAIAFL